MKQSRDLMGMPITIEILDKKVLSEHFDRVFDYFIAVDERFSTYKENSEISKINRGEIQPENYSDEMKEVFKLSEQTKKETNGFFDIKNPQGIIDPSGLVKGWAIYNASKILKEFGLKDFFIDAGGDIQPSGHAWRVGIRNPFNQEQIIKVVYVHDEGVATSGTYIRGSHIYDPHEPKKNLADIVSITVIGPNIYEADRFATAAFAMGAKGIEFIENLPGFEGYSVDEKGIGTATSGFLRYNNDNA